jgi:hypothetical protein
MHTLKAEFMSRWTPGPDVSRLAVFVINIHDSDHGGAIGEGRSDVVVRRNTQHTQSMHTSRTAGVVVAVKAVQSL